MSQTKERKEVTASPVPANASGKDLVMKYMSVAIDNAPKQMQPHLKRAVPIVLKLYEVVEKLSPLVEKLYAKWQELWVVIEPHKPHLLIPAFAGFVMCFFGGSFLTLIAAIEAFNMCGYDSTVACLKMLAEDLKIVLKENEKDDQKDEDGDGVADVLQVSSSQLIFRKTQLFLKVADPNRISQALTGITAGGMAVVAALKLRFAKTIALGNSIAECVEKPADVYVLPQLERLCAPEYKKWARPVMVYTIKSIAVSIAWTVQRILSAFHSAIRGGLMFARNIMEYLSEMGYYKVNHEDSLMDEAVGYGLALVGLYFQLAFGFGLPFPLNILLFPFRIAEYLLIWLVNK